MEFESENYELVLYMRNTYVPRIILF